VCVVNKQAALGLFLCGLIAAPGAVGALAEPVTPRPIRLPVPVRFGDPAGPPSLRLQVGDGYVIEDVAEVDEPIGSFAGHAQTLKFAGKTLGHWRFEGGDTSTRLIGFRHGNTVLLAARVATSNGLGLQYWQLLGIELAGNEPVAAPVRWLSLDFGPDAVRSGGSRLEILATEWTYPAYRAAHPSLQFVGTWYGLTGGGLLACGATRMRPYLNSFERERDLDGGNELYSPARWLRVGKANVCSAGDPRLGPEVALRKRGTLEAVNGGDDGLEIDFRDSHGELRKFWLAGFGESPPGRQAIARVGENGRLQPDGYRPSRPSDWAGKAATVASYNGATVLWLGDPGH
jgi:hypothetical protein